MKKQLKKNFIFLFQGGGKYTSDKYWEEETSQQMFWKPTKTISIETTLTFLSTKLFQGYS